MRDRDHLVHARDQLGKHLVIEKTYGVPPSLVAKKNAPMAETHRGIYFEHWQRV